MAKRRCRECGTVYEAAFQHCPACGAEGGRRVARCRACGSRLTPGTRGKCPVCGASLSLWPRLATVCKLSLAIVVGVLLAVSFIFAYRPQLGLPQPTWPTRITSTATVTATATHTSTRLPSASPTASRTKTPTATRVPPTATKPPPVTYVVQFGDNLTVIAEKFRVSIEAIMIANGLSDRELIREDQILIIPTGTPTPPVPPATPTFRPSIPVTRLPAPTPIRTVTPAPGAAGSRP